MISSLFVTGFVRTKMLPKSGSETKVMMGTKTSNGLEILLIQREVLRVKELNSVLTIS